MRHRVLAYRRGAARMRGTTQSVARMALEGRAIELPDIGATLQSKIVELARDRRDRGPRRRPASASPRASPRSPGWTASAPSGPSPCGRELGVRDLDELAAAVADGRLDGVSGLRAGHADPDRGAARAPGRAAAARPRGACRSARRSRLAEALAAALRAAVPGARVEIAGSLRRGRESVHDIDLVGTADDPAALLDALAALPSVRARALGR